jgi:hypothetical protein
LKILLVATGGAAVVAVGLRGSLRGLLHQLADPALDKTAIGPLSGHAITTLLATTEAFLGSPVEKAHYEDFFRWHAETLPGYHALYERFAATVNQAARRAHGCDFAGCEVGMRQTILAPAFRAHRVESRIAHTDAWRVAGYDAWPGIPRGLERYTQPHLGKAK